MAKGRPLVNNQRHSNAPSHVRLKGSPPRQLQIELDKTFAQLQIYDNERQKLHAFNRKSLQEELDARELAQAIAHRTEIEEAIAKHEVVRQQAVAVLEAHIREEEERRRQLEEEERRRKEEEARRRAEEKRRIAEEQERRAREETEKAEATKRAAAEKAKAEQEKRERKQREATAEKERQAQIKAEADAEAARKKVEAAQAATTARQAALVPDQLVADNEPLWSSHPEVRHRQYLNIHQRLKDFRKDFWAKAKKDPQLKPHVGDMRRTIKTSVGQQTTDDKTANSRATKKIKDVLLKALKEIPSSPVIVNEYLPAHLELLDKNTTTVPSLVLYLVSMFSKAIVIAFANECASNTKAAEPLGTMVAQIFSMPDLQFKRNVPSPNSGIHYSAFGGTAPTPPMTPDSVSLISVLIAKLHAIAPVLFGVSGNEKTNAGKLRLGWRQEFAKDGDTEKSFLLTAKQHYRMTGIGAGYASIALRNFSKTTLTNPWPPYHFWESVSYIVNTKSADIQPTHCYLLRSMLENSLDRVLQFFGDEGVAALRIALIDFPNRLSPELKASNAGVTISFLASTWTTECNFRLE